MQMVFQDPYSSLNPRWRAERIIAEPILTHEANTSRDGRRARVEALLEQVGLAPQDRTRYPHEFSGGQRQRLSIARALASRPDFIVCDEPTSALDVSVQAQILNLMMDLQRELQLTYLFISHDLAVVKHVSDHVAVMYLGRFVEWGPADTLLTKPCHPYTQMLLDTVPKIEDPNRDREPLGGEVPNPLTPPSGCAFHPRCPYARDVCRRVEPVPVAAYGRMVACHAVEQGWLPRDHRAESQEERRHEELGEYRGKPSHRLGLR
jgi:peptide/nickel transport system ATP-binding protein